MLAGRAKPCGDEKRADLVAVQADGVRLVVDAGTAHMYRWGVGDEAFLLGVAVEAGHGAQPPGDRRCRPTVRLESPAEGLDVAAVHLEQLEVPSAAERHELAQVEGVGVAGEAPVVAEEPGQRNMFRIDQAGVVDDDGSRGGGGHGIPPESVELGGRGGRTPHG